MTFRPTLQRLVIAAFLIIPPITNLPAAESNRPNVILVLADDLGLSRVSCYGGAPFKTPHLDQMAAAGLRFERCYSMPLCGPSRSVLLTGKYPFRTGALSNNSSIIDPAKHPTIANVLRQAGYATCAIGKLGQSAEPDDPAAPERLGFDESMLWMGRATPDRYWQPRYYQNGHAVQGGAQDYGPDKTHEFLVDFLHRRRTKPFFVYYSAVLTHEPYTKTPDSNDARHLVEDMTAYLDKLMGRLVADLEKLGLRENTIILFTSDNGPAGNPPGTIDGQPMLGGKGQATEGGVREPLIVSAPGRVSPSAVSPAAVSPDLIDFSDFFPTILELTGTEKPASLKLDGQSFAPQILGKQSSPRTWIYSQLGKDYFIANRDHKLYGDGRLLSIRRSPIAEDPIDESASPVREARTRLQQQLDRLRAGFPSSRGSAAPRAALSGPSQAQLESDLAILTAAGILKSPEPWKQALLKGDPIAGDQVAELIAAAAKKLQPASHPQKSVDVLKTEGVLASAAYWKEHAAAGKTCNPANVTRLLQKLAQRLKSS